MRWWGFCALVLTVLASTVALPSETASHVAEAARRDVSRQLLWSELGESADDEGQSAVKTVSKKAVKSAVTGGCNDGNLKSGDGCSNTNLVEPGWTCKWHPHQAPTDACVIYELKKQFATDVAKLLSKPVAFSAGSSELAVDGKQTLQKLVPVLTRYPWMEVVIEATSPATGAKGQGLVAGRAESTANFLTCEGAANKFIKRGKQARSIGVSIFASGFSPNDAPPRGCGAKAAPSVTLEPAAEPESMKTAPASDCGMYKAKETVNKAFARTLKQPVRYHAGTGILTKAGRGVLRKITTTVKMYPWMEIVVESQSPARGLHGMELTSKRAKDAVTFLKESGCPNKFQQRGKYSRVIGLVVYAAGSSPHDVVPPSCNATEAKQEKGDKAADGESSDKAADGASSDEAVDDESSDTPIDGKTVKKNDKGDDKAKQEKGDKAADGESSDKAAVGASSDEAVDDESSDTPIDGKTVKKNDKGDDKDSGGAAQTFRLSSATELGQGMPIRRLLQTTNKMIIPDKRGISKCVANPAYEKDMKEGKTKVDAASKAKAESSTKERESKEVVEKNKASEKRLKGEQDEIRFEHKKAEEKQQKAVQKLKDAEADGAKKAAEGKIMALKQEEKMTKSTTKELDSKKADATNKLSKAADKESQSKTVARSKLKDQELKTSKAESANKAQAIQVKRETIEKEKDMKKSRRNEILAKKEQQTEEEASKEGGSKSQHTRELGVKEKELKNRVYSQDKARVRESKNKNKKMSELEDQEGKELNTARVAENEAEEADEESKDAQKDSREVLKTVEKSSEKADKAAASKTKDTEKHSKLEGQSESAREEAKKESEQEEAVDDAVLEKDTKLDRARFKVEGVVKETAYKAIGFKDAAENLDKERASKSNENAKKMTAKENQIKGRQDELQDKSEMSSKKNELAIKTLNRAGGGEAGKSAAAGMKESRQKQDIVRSYSLENEQKSDEIVTKASELRVKARKDKSTASAAEASVEKATKTANDKVVAQSEKQYSALQERQRAAGKRQFEKGQKAGYRKVSAGAGFEKGEKTGIKEAGGLPGAKDCTDATECSPGNVIKKVCLKPTFNSCCNQCVPAGEEVPPSGGGNVAATGPGAAGAGGASWKEVWQKNLGRWRNAMGAESLAPSLSHAELAPTGKGGVVPYRKAGSVSQQGAARAEFSDGQSENVQPNDFLPPAAKSAAGGGTGTSSPNVGWKEVWVKNMHRWRSSLHTAPARASTTPGVLSASEAAPAAENAQPYPAGESNYISRKQAVAAPFSTARRNT